MKFLQRYEIFRIYANKIDNLYCTTYFREGCLYEIFYDSIQYVKSFSGSYDMVSLCGEQS
jgi:hypothetical protein